MDDKHVIGRPAEHECCSHVQAARAVLADRERELLKLKGPCSNKRCRLHYAHSGPCDERQLNYNWAPARAVDIPPRRALSDYIAAWADGDTPRS